jgi:hypothetical protein
MSALLCHSISTTRETLLEFAECRGFYSKIQLLPLVIKICGLDLVEMGHQSGRAVVESHTTGLKTK